MAILREQPDQPAPDIVISVWLISCCLISTTLNPLVFLYNCRPPHTVQRVVYRVLSVLDFTICVLTPSIVVPNALTSANCKGESPKDPTTYNNIKPALCSRDASTVEKIYSGVTLPCVYLPTILTGVLTITRLYHIKFPLKDPRHKEIIAGLIVLCGVESSFKVIPLFDSSDSYRNFHNTTEKVKKVSWWAPIQKASNMDPFDIGGQYVILWTPLIQMIFPILAQVAGFLATFLTIEHIRDLSQDAVAQQAQRDSVKVTKKILMTNAASLFKTILFIAYHFCIVASLFILPQMCESNPDSCSDDSGGFKVPSVSFARFAAWANLTHSILGPCFISAGNPIIFIAMTPNCWTDIRQSIKALFDSCRKKIAEVVPIGTT